MLMLAKKTKQPICEDALAALVKQPVNKKKRTKRVKCEQAESSHANEQLQTVCWDPLANQHNKPNKKKRTKRVVCEEAESSHANEQLQTVCWEPLANQHNKPNKKKRTKRVVCEEAESSHANEQLQTVCWEPLANQHNEPDKKKRRIRPKVDCGPVKVLYMNDLAPCQNRLNLPLKQLLTEDFLSDQERWILESDGEIKVRLVAQNLKMFKEPMELKI
nr:B3 domain-containing protein, DNA-binding pseudobarrel domain protein [Tanacetum cinerariifolium]